MYLDMWPVNLTKITKEHVKEECPGMIIRYVPAGATGLYQVRLSLMNPSKKLYSVTISEINRTGWRH